MDTGEWETGRRRPWHKESVIFMLVVTDMTQWSGTKGERNNARREQTGKMRVGHGQKIGLGLDWMICLTRRPGKENTFLFK